MIASAMGAAFGQSPKQNNPRQNRGSTSGGFKSGMGTMFNRGPSKVRPPDGGMSPSPVMQNKALGGFNPINAIEQPMNINPSQSYPGLDSQMNQPEGGIGPSPNMDFQSLMGQMGQPMPEGPTNIGPNPEAFRNSMMGRQRPDVMPRRERMQIGPSMM